MRRRTVIAVIAAVALSAMGTGAQQPSSDPVKPTAPAAAVSTPNDYVIGPQDVLGVRFWRDESMSGDAVVRPDGKITLQLLNDVPAAGLTTEQLRDALTKLAAKFLEDPAVTVTVKQLNSRRVTVIGEVGKQGPLPLNGPLSVIEAIGMAGGVTEFANSEKIMILRTENGAQKTLPFDFKAIKDGKKLEQNIQLMPGDTVLVP